MIACLLSSSLPADGALLLPIVIVFSVCFVLQARLSVTFRGFIVTTCFRSTSEHVRATANAFAQFRELYIYQYHVSVDHFISVRSGVGLAAMFVNRPTLLTADELCSVVVTLPKR